MAITDLATYKVHARLSVSTFDTEIEAAIDAAEEAFKRYTGQSFEAATYTEIHSPNGGRVVTVNSTPITSITSLQEIDASDNVSHTYAESSYTVDLDAGVIRIATSAYNARIVADANGPHRQDVVGPPSGFGYLPSRVKVVYVGGQATVDPDIVRAVNRLVDLYLAENGRDPALQSKALGSANYTLKSGADYADARAQIMNPFRRLSRYLG